MAQKFIQAQKQTLSGSGVTSTATTVILTSFKTPDTTKILTTDLGTTAYATLEPGTSREEIISFTTVTQNADGTATLTGVTRGLGFVSPYTTVAANKKAHAGGTIFVMSDNPQLYEDLISFNNDETITGTWTFSTAAFPQMSDGTTAPTANEDLATKKYVDDTAGGTPVSQNRIVLTATAGATVADGECVYFDETDNEWKLTDASVTGTADNLQLGIAQGAGTNGAAIVGGVLLLGRDDGQAGFAAGDPVFLSDTAGLLQNTAGTVSVQVGTAISATEIDFTPSYYKSVATASEKAAMAGTSGTVGTGNLFATELGNQRAVENYAVDAAGSDTYVVTLDPVPAGYVAGMTIRVLFGTLNTGAATINVNSLGAKAITKEGALALITGDILVNQVSVLVYDGTQFQLQAVATQDLKSGADASTLHDHDRLLGLNLAGTKYGYPLHIDNAQWTFTDCIVGTGVAGYTRIDSNAATWYITGTLPNVNGDADASLKWDQTKTITVEWRAQMVGTTGDKCMGFSLATDLAGVYTSVGRKVSFSVDGSTLYAVTADGTTNNNTDISAGLTLTNWNTYKIVWTAGTNALFYVNGTLLATETSNIPSGTNDSPFGFGGTTDAEEWNIAGIHIIQTL